MFSKNTYFFGCLLSIATIVACSKESEDIFDHSLPPEGVGNVYLYNESTQRVSDAGMRVYIENSLPWIEDITDSSGRFVLNSIPQGTFYLVFEKEGFGTHKRAYYRFPGPTSGPFYFDASPSLGQISSTRITDLQVDTAGENFVFQVTTDPPGSASNFRYVRFLLSSDPNIDHQNHEVSLPPLAWGINPFQFNISTALLKTLGYTSGQTVYIRAFGDSYWSNEYQDPVTQKSVFPNLNPDAAAAVSVVVP